MYIDVLSAFDQNFYLKIEISFLLFLYYHVSFLFYFILGFTEHAEVMR